MARNGIFSRLRRRRRALCLGFAYALLLNALLAVGLSAQAVAAALDPLAAAATCDSTGSPPGSDPARQGSPHQPDCTLCGPACPMMGAATTHDGIAPVAGTASPPAGVAVAAPRRHGIRPPSIYLSDTAAQAPPAIG